MEYEAIRAGCCPFFDIGHSNSIVPRLYIEKFTTNVLITWNVMQGYGSQSLKSMESNEYNQEFELVWFLDSK